MAQHPFWGPVSSGRLSKEHVNVEAYYGFVPSIISLEQLKELNSDPRLLGVEWIFPEVGALLMLLMLAATFYIHLDHAAITLAQYGYCIMDTEMFETVADARIAEVRSIVQNLTSSNQLPITGDELLRALERCSGSTWPLLSGSPIRRDGNKICVDLYGATTCLHSLIEFPHVQGQLANARADHFELAAQKIIDGSPWRPDENLRQVRGRTQRYANVNVTDIDAIGVHGKTLLMVSCKSVVYSSAYDTGNYDTVRNTGGLIEKAVKYWRDKLF